MEEQQLKILLIEDDPQDLELLRKIISETKLAAIHIEHADLISQALKILSNKEAKIDVILLDTTLSDSQEMDGLIKIQAVAHNIPIILLGKSDNESVEAEAIAKGAHDYLVKNRLNSRAISRILRYAIEKHREKIILEKTVRELRTLNQFTSNFISSLSHELHTPLTVINATAKSFLDGLFGEMNEQQLKWIKNIDSNAQRLSNLIDDILDFSKLESGRLKTKKTLFNLRDLIFKVVNDILPIVQKKEIRLRWECSDNLIEIYADPKRIEQVITNLLTNSIKYTSEGGNINLRVLKLSDSVQVEVSDTGIGMDPAKCDIIFERFIQLEEKKTSSEGIGLGLAISKEIIRAHEGKIWAKSDGIGKGSRFFFTLPIDLSQMELKKPTVLVVDNDPDVLDLLKTILEDLKFNVILAKDGAEGIAHIVQSEMRTPIDLLVVDLFLPIRNGMEVIKQMKIVNPKTLIIMVTGHSNSQLLQDAMKFSSFTLLKKPFEVEEVRTILGSLMIPARGKNHGENHRNHPS